METSYDGMIRLSNIDKAYRVDGREITVFDRLNFEINPKKITVLTGKSGCGKTTMLRILAGLEQPTKGKIKMPEGLCIGMMFQEPRLMPWLTCEKNVTLGLNKPSKKETEGILSLVGLEGFERAYPSQLSGGMQQRAALARTLIRKPNLILMDEPFSALDDVTKKTMQEELLRIRAETKAGIVFVTHDMTEAFRIGDIVIAMQNNTMEEIYREKVDN